MGLIINAHSRGQNPAFAGWLCPSTVGALEQSVRQCENVHMYSGDLGRRQSGNICTGGENESAFNTWRELNVLGAAH